MKRRSFLKALGATAAVSTVSLPAIVQAERLPALHGDLVHDDTDALNAMLAREPYIDAATGKRMTGDGVISGGQYLTTGPLEMHSWTRIEGVDVYLDDDASPWVKAGPGLVEAEIRRSRFDRRPSSLDLPYAQVRFQGWGG